MGKSLKLKAVNSFPAPGQLGSMAASASIQHKRTNNNKDSRQAKTPFAKNTSLGQHLLKNPGVVTKIIEAAKIQPSDVVLEIGPGTGNLTVKLCELGRKIVALEVDPRMAAEVKKRCLALGHTNVDIRHADALKGDLGDFHVCVANLPYQVRKTFSQNIDLQISSPFLFRLLTHPNPFRAAVLMFQKEFGERLLATPGSKFYCRLAINAQLFAKITRVCNVAAGSFNPPPKVDSVVVKICPIKQYSIVSRFKVPQNTSAE